MKKLRYIKSASDTFLKCVEFSYLINKTFATESNVNTCINKAWAVVRHVIFSAEV